MDARGGGGSEGKKRVKSGKSRMVSLRGGDKGEKRAKLIRAK